MLNKDKRIRIFTGHYGSGKTEVGLNYAIRLASNNKKVALVDLDVVNLYFRSREKAEYLERMGIHTIGSSIKGNSLDIPAISGEVLTPLQDITYDVVLDLGGNPAGARVLGMYHEYLDEKDYDMFFILNANRPETQKVNNVIEFINSIEEATRKKITGIINNTHLLKSTTFDDVLKGSKLAREVSDLTNIPIRYNVILESKIDGLKEIIEGEIFPINIVMREDWML